MTPAEAAFWAAYKTSGAAPADADQRYHSSFGVGAGSDEGAALILSGAKTATSARPADFGDQPPPGPGSLSILLGAGGVPRAVVETLSMRPSCLEAMDDGFVAAYAEWPDRAAFIAGMLDWYRQADPDFGPRSTLLAERFRVVWVPD
jgi:uncharacterized protein YhfF